MTFRYNEHARALEDSLVDILSEGARDSAVKEAEASSTKKLKSSGGLDRILTARTPVEEVRAIMEEQGLKTAAQKIVEHVVRGELIKRAGLNKKLVSEFVDLTRSK